MDRETEIENMAERALDRADAAYGKWETHEQICAERYKRLDGTMSRVSDTLDKAMKIGLGVILAVTGTMGVALLNLLISRLP